MKRLSSLFLIILSLFAWYGLASAAWNGISGGDFENTDITISGDTGSGYGYSLYIYDEDSSDSLRLYQDGGVSNIVSSGYILFATSSATQFNRDLWPSSDGGAALGTTTRYWSDIYGDEYFVQNAGWIQGNNSAGTDYVNMWRVNSDDKLEQGSPIIGAGPTIIPVGNGTPSGLVLYRVNDTTTSDGDDLSYDIAGYDTTTMGLLSMIRVSMSSDGAGGLDTPLVSFPQGYQREIDIAASAAQVGATAPTPTTIGTMRGLGFDADAEVAFFTWEVPGDWDAASDMTLEVYWCAESGDAVADTETVKLDVDYRSISHTDTGTEAIDNGTAVSITATYTQSGAGTDKGCYEEVMTIDYDHADQPLASGDIVYMLFNRDVTTDTYSGDVIVTNWEIIYTSTALPTH